MTWRAAIRVHWQQQVRPRLPNVHGRAGWRPVFRCLLWVILATAVLVFTWVLWTETLHRR